MPRIPAAPIAGWVRAAFRCRIAEYYLKADAKSVETRQRFVAHVTKMFQLLGDTAEIAAGNAQMVIDLETILAKAAMDRVAMRDPNKTYHILTKPQWPSSPPTSPGTSISRPPARRPSRRST